MNTSQYIKTEFKRLFTKKSMLISVLICILVPLVYAMIMLSPKWGPYDNLDNLPVAVVNSDEGAVKDGENINVGNELVENLKSNEELGWEFVTKEEAQRGMDRMKYYMMIEVPPNFSKNALTVLDEDPQRPELKFIQNEGLHFMAAQVTNKAVETLQNQLSTQVTETYVENVFSQLGDVADGFSEAHDGSEQINDGADQLKDGTDEILSSLIDKSSDISRLADGAEELNAGTGTLKDSLVDKQPDISRLADGALELNAGTGTLLSNLQNKSSDIAKLADGAQQVNDGTGLLLSTLNEKSSDIKKLSDGAIELEAGAKELQAGSKQLLEGAKTAKDGSAQLKAGLDEQLVPGSAELAAGVLQAQQGVNETIESMGTLYDSLEFLSTLDKDHPMYDGILNTVLEQLEQSLQEAPQKQNDFQRLVDGANQLRDGLKKGSEFNNGLSALNNGLAELVEGQEQLNAGANQLADGASQIADGNKTVKSGWDELEKNVAVLHDGTTQIADGNKTVKSGWKELTSGATQLHDGSTQIAAGNQSVESGWRELTAGATQLHDGSTQIADGNQTVEEGWGALTDGVTQVDNGLGELLDGSGQLVEGLLGGVERTSSLNPTDANKTMFAAPVVLDGEVINSFPFYRDSNAPYILTLALFVGVLAMSFVVPYRKPASLPSTGMSWFIGKVTNLSVLVIAQAILISLFSLFVLKIEVQSSISFIFFSIWVSLTFLMIILFLIALAGNIGRFVALAFVVIQLSTTGSDLPIHMLPEGLRKLSTFLPFTYSLDGYNNIITLGSMSKIWANTGVLFIYFIVFAALSLIVFLIRHRTKKGSNEFSEEIGESIG